MRIFVTGAAGFIGFHTAQRLLSDGHEVFGYDGMTPYYDVSLKRARMRALKDHPAFEFVEAMLEDENALRKAVKEFAPDTVIHLAAQAGVRYSLEQPAAYVDSNIAGTFNLLQILRDVPIKHFLFASTSSVYGANSEVPFREHHRADSPVSLYAATKKSGEAMTHSYSHLFKIPTTCFRFFTAYGPWGRPDMALFKFVKSIDSGDPIDVYGNGQMRRDFTFIDDIVEAIVRLMVKVPVPGQPVLVEGGEDTLSAVAPWRVVNIAGGQPVELMDFISVVEACLSSTARKRMLPMQQGDVVQTYADASLLEALVGYRPATQLDFGVAKFVEWYRAYHSVKA